MKIVINNIIPFVGFKAMTIWPWIFLRKGQSYNLTDDNHEEIHGDQQKEMLLLFFFIWYGIEYLIRLIIYWNKNDAYYNISFEQEAYLFQDDYDYRRKRKAFAWFKYVFKKSFITKKR